MLKRCLALLLIALPLFAATKPVPAVMPDDLDHSIAMFLSNLSANGKRKVTFKATAVGTHFFFEEATGVKVYVFDGTSYKRKAFLKGATLASALKKYGAK